MTLAILCHLGSPITISPQPTQSQLISTVSVTWLLQHSGFLHVALGCWVLLIFGPRVCRAYGQMPFFLIYILGGICGNLTSFAHTPETTVCGTVSYKPTWYIILDGKKPHASALLFSHITLTAILTYILLNKQ